MCGNSVLYRFYRGRCYLIVDVTFLDELMYLQCVVKLYVDVTFLDEINYFTSILFLS